MLGAQTKTKAVSELYATFGIIFFTILIPETTVGAKGSHQTRIMCTVIFYCSNVPHELVDLLKTFDFSIFGL